MRILMTNFALMAVGGTEKWCWTMARELVRREHRVEMFTYRAGEVAKRLEAIGVPVHTEVPAGPFDLVLCNHGICLNALPKGEWPIIFTSHGPHNPMEVPPKGADAYVAVTPEVRAGWAWMGMEMTVITNPVDLDEFYPDGPALEPPRVLSMCKIPVACNMVATACVRLGYPFEGVHYTQKPEWHMAAVIRRNDIVVGCGRSAYEGLACGKQVLVFDARNHRQPKADGWMTEANADDLFARNCACRTKDLDWGVTEVTEALLHAPVTRNWQRNFAERNCNVRNKVDQYLELARSKGGLSDANQ